MSLSDLTGRYSRQSSAKNIYIYSYTIHSNHSEFHHHPTHSYGLMGTYAEFGPTYILPL